MPTFHTLPTSYGFPSHVQFITSKLWHHAMFSPVRVARFVHGRWFSKISHEMLWTSVPYRHSKSYWFVFLTKEIFYENSWEFAFLFPPFISLSLAFICNLKFDYHTFYFKGPIFTFIFNLYCSYHSRTRTLSHCLELRMLLIFLQPSHMARTISYLLCLEEQDYLQR